MSSSANSISFRNELTADLAYKGLSVLIVDEDANILRYLCDMLGRLSFQVTTVANLIEANKRFSQTHFDITLLDITPEKQFDDSWNQKVKQRMLLSSCVIFMADELALSNAVSGMKLGACDLILKPLVVEQVTNSVSHCASRILQKRKHFAQDRDFKRFYPDAIVGSSEQTKQLIKSIEQFAPSKATVLVDGGSGTGKELVARELHQQSRRYGPFIAVNCSISEKKLKQELFSTSISNEQREGLFQLANGGTLFLDRVGELPMSVQGELLRVIDESCIRSTSTNQTTFFDVRIIAATNKDLKREVEEKRFREDLYYRLSVLQINLTPLKERKDDLYELIPYLTEKMLQEQGCANSLSWTEHDIRSMQEYDWPGNVRELRNIIERCILVGKPKLEYWSTLNQSSKEWKDHTTHNVSNQTESGTIPDLSPANNVGYPNEWTLKDVEKAHILQVVNYYDGNKSAAARHLGIARKTLERKYKSWE